MAKKHNLPIIADEIYSGLVFDGEFCPFHLLCDTVPVITLGGIAKEFLVPGWRVGWIVVHDSTGSMTEVRRGLKSLTQLIIGANSLVQVAMPSVLCPVKGSKEDVSIQKFKFKYLEILQSNIQLCHKMITESQTPYLSIVSLPKGAMYIMIKIHFEALAVNAFVSDTDFSERLLQSENLVVLPGQCFGMSGYIRLVICPPHEILQAALTRMIDFCHAHRRVKTEEEVIAGTTTPGAESKSRLIESDLNHSVGSKRQKM